MPFRRRGWSLEHLRVFRIFSADSGLNVLDLPLLLSGERLSYLILRLRDKHQGVTNLLHSSLTPAFEVGRDYSSLTILSIFLGFVNRGVEMQRQIELSVFI